MFDQLELAPPDAIMGLNEAFRNDPNTNKINLTVGVYKDAQGVTPVFSAVKKAEERLLRTETTKTYLPIEGAHEYAARVQELILGPGHEIIIGRRAVTADTPGGTAALRIAADLIHKLSPDTTVWLSEPTWPNHPGIFDAAGLTIRTYPYYDAPSHGLDFDGMKAALQMVAAGDVVLLHGCCHNPTGIDPTLDQWTELAQLLRERMAIPFFDFAYQGLGDGLEPDAQGLRAFATEGCELLVASSFSKNFGLYCERTGALTLVTHSAESAVASLSHLKRAIRVSYSNPPAHGAAVVTTILGDPQLRGEWEEEVRGMCRRINSMRQLFVDTLRKKGVERDFSFLTRQRGMFSYSGLTMDQVDALREKFSVYIVGSGRINVAAITEHNMDALCDAVADVLNESG